MTVKELKGALDGLGIEYPSTAKKADLEALYESSLSAEVEDEPVSEDLAEESLEVEEVSEASDDESAGSEDVAEEAPEEVELSTYDGREYYKSEEVLIGGRLMRQYWFLDGSKAREVI